MPDRWSFFLTNKKFYFPLYYEMFFFAINRVMLSIVMYIPGEDDESRLLRKTLCQNCNLMLILLLRTISDSVRSKYKTIGDLVKAGKAQFTFFLPII